MNRLLFIKENENWLLDTDEALYRTRCGKRPFLQDATHFFECIGRQRSTLGLLLHTEPFPSAYQLRLLHMGHPKRGGGFYRLFDPLGRVCRPKLWLCDLPLLVFGDIPEVIYAKPCS